MFCKDDKAIFDSFIPLNGRGRLAGLAMSAFNRGKYVVKHNQALFRVARWLRHALN
jgi:CelD/BcsL family acetyltransferase involved in cellulose biosynthesis